MSWWISERGRRALAGGMESISRRRIGFRSMCRLVVRMDSASPAIVRRSCISARTIMRRVMSGGSSGTIRPSPFLGRSRHPSCPPRTGAYTVLGRDGIGVATVSTDRMTIREQVAGNPVWNDRSSVVRTCSTRRERPRRMLEKIVQQGRSELSLKGVGGMIPTARNISTRPPTGTPRRAICPGEGLLIPQLPQREQADCSSLRASSDVHAPSKLARFLSRDGC